MELNIEKKMELKDRLISFYKSNKLKLIILMGLLTLTAIIIIFINIKNQKKNNLIAEKYVQAGLYLSLEKNDQSKDLYEEIILSKNKFYSILSLNTIIEKNLISDESKILKYFEIVNKVTKTREQNDILKFKKALYLIKIGNSERGIILLNQLIKDNSSIKSLAEELIPK
jgi:tetratricopeptide (TPR) repeat protein